VLSVSWSLKINTGIILSNMPQPILSTFFQILTQSSYCALFEAVQIMKLTLCSYGNNNKNRARNVFHNCTPFIPCFTKVNKFVPIILIHGFKLGIFYRLTMSVSQSVAKNKSHLFRSLKGCMQQTYTIKNSDTYQTAL
jgi:hypothetical protein